MSCHRYARNLDSNYAGDEEAVKTGGLTTIENVLPRDSAEKALYAIFWTQEHIILIDPVLNGSTVTGNHYKEFQHKQQLPALQQRRPRLVNDGFILNQTQGTAPQSRIFGDFLLAE